MNWGEVEKLANAVLYEGYLLYPYRSSSVKNQQRFNFGVLYPRAWCELQSGADAWEMRTEYIIEGHPDSALEVKTRFLQIIERDGRQEGLERDVIFASPIAAPKCVRFDCGAFCGEIELSAVPLGGDAYKLILRVTNSVNLAHPADLSRDDLLLRSMVSVHSILHSSAGKFVSLLDPPERFAEAAAACRNVGAWPVLVGKEGERELMLASPVILYDYPQIAPESPGDLCDGTEIDEILSLRILTLTDAEKAEIRTGDARAREILERTETLPPEHFQKLHGALRGAGLPACAPPSKP